MAHVNLNGSANGLARAAHFLLWLCLLLAGAAGEAPWPGVQKWTNYGSSIISASLLRRDGWYVEATVAAKEAIAFTEQVYGSASPQMAEPLTNLGECYRMRGMFTHAPEPLLKAIAIFEQTLGADHPYLAFPLNALGDVYRSLGQYEPAEPLLLRALAIREKSLGNSLHTGQSLLSVSSLYRGMGQHDKALAAAERSYTMLLQAGSEDVYRASALTLLGSIYTERREFARAETLLRQGLSIRRNLLRPDHPSIGRSLYALGNWYAAQGRVDEGEPLLRRASRLRQDAAGNSFGE